MSEVLPPTDVTWALVLSDDGQRVLRQEQKLLGRFLSEDDLRQAGLLGLHRAAQRFDPALGFKFSTYARKWVRAEMTAAIERSRPLRVPYATITSRIRDLERTLREQPDLSEADVARKLGISADRLANIRAASAASYVPVADLDDEPLLGTAHNPETRLIAWQAARALPDAIADVLAGLPSRMRRIVVMYFGLFGAPARTLEAISEVLGCSEERVRQLLHVALADLRVRLERP